MTYPVAVQTSRAHSERSQRYGPKLGEMLIATALGIIFSIPIDRWIDRHTQTHVLAELPHGSATAQYLWIEMPMSSDHYGRQLVVDGNVVSDDALTKGQMRRELELCDKLTPEIESLLQ